MNQPPGTESVIQIRGRWEISDEEAVQQVRAAIEEHVWDLVWPPCYVDVRFVGRIETPDL